MEKRRHVPAWLAEAGHAQASISFPRLVAASCEQLLTHSSPLPIWGDCLASFPRTGGNVRGRPLIEEALREGQNGTASASVLPALPE